MRTTVTLDDDLVIWLEQLQQEQRRSFKSVINEVIRAGIEAVQRGPSTDPQTSYTDPLPGRLCLADRKQPLAT